ncbi:MAG TPA: peptidoglycan-associated lipoprotein Pal [Thermoanaerobaculia bacterium]|jgi:peptidoglycan-associated lipoprotein
MLRRTPVASFPFTGLVVAVSTIALLLSLGGCAKKSPKTAGSLDATGSRAAAPGTDLATYEDGAAGGDVGTSELDSSALLGAVYFDFDRYELRAESRQQLAHNAEYLIDNPQVLVTIEGHCDERGTNAYNLALGSLRAEAARQYLVSLGVDGGRLETVSYGEERPLCTESGESCWRLNRRAHFMVAGHSKIG